MRYRLTKQTGDMETVKWEDARSRVLIWAINHADSREISKLGNLTYIPNQGFSDSSGSICVSTIDSGITYMATSSSRVTMLQSTSFVPASEPLDELYKFESILWKMLGDINYIALAEKLGLNRKNPDKISGKLIRSFAELSSLIPQIKGTLLIRNGDLRALYWYTQENVYEVKYFKFNDCHGEHPFRFKPCQSGVWVPDYNLADAWRFSTSIHIAQANSDMGWICTAGGVDKLDLEIFRNINPEIIWPYYHSDPLFNRTALAEIWPILTKAKRLNIKMQVRQVKGTGTELKEWVEDNATSILGESELRKCAREQGIELDPIWYPKSYEVSLHPRKDNGSPSYFWPNGLIALFECKKAEELMKELLIFFSKSRNIVVVIPVEDKIKAQKLCRGLENNTTITIVNTGILTDAPEFEKTLREKKAEVVFFFMENTENNKSSQEFERGVDLAGKAELPIAIFSTCPIDENPLKKLADHFYFVGDVRQSAAFCVKDLGKEEIKKYLFKPTGEVHIEPGTEEDMKN